MALEGNGVKYANNAKAASVGILHTSIRKEKDMTKKMETG